MNDKLKHFIACAAISLLTLMVLALIGTNWDGYEKLLAIAIGTLAAAAKELVWDKLLGKGKADVYDFVAGLLGAYAGTFAWIVVETLILYL